MESDCILLVPSGICSIDGVVEDAGRWPYSCSGTSEMICLAFLQLNLHCIVTMMTCNVSKREYAAQSHMQYWSVTRKRSHF